MECKFEFINEKNFNKYRKFTFPRYRDVFFTEEGKKIYFGLGVYKNNEAIGLIMGKPNTDYPENMVVVSVFVLGEYRRKGIGTVLFEKFEKDAEDKGYRGLEVWYIDNREGVRYIEKILKKLNWVPPKVSEYIYKCGIDNVNHDWINKFKFKKDFSYCRFDELTAVEKIYLKEGDGVWYPKELNPFIEEEKINKKITLFLKYKDKIVGWCSTFNASSETIVYRSVFIQKRFQNTGMIIPLLARAIQIHCENIDKIPYAAFEIVVGNKPMEKIIKKGVSNGFVSITKKYISYKFI